MDPPSWRVQLRACLNALDGRHNTIRDAIICFMQNTGYASEAVELWFTEFKDNAAKQLSFLYVANEAIRPKDKALLDLFEKVLPPCLLRFSRTAKTELVGKVERLINIWGVDACFDENTINKFKSCLRGDDLEIKQMVDSNADSFRALLSPQKEQEEPIEKELSHEKGLTVKQESEADISDALLAAGWNGLESYEGARDILDKCDDIEKHTVLEQSSPVARDPKYAKLLRLISEAEEADIHDDMIFDKVKSNADALDKILKHEKDNAAGSGETKEQMVPEDDTGEIYYSIKVTEEHLKVNLREFLELLKTHKERIAEAMERREKLMEVVEAVHFSEEDATTKLDSLIENSTKEFESLEKLNDAIEGLVHKRKAKHDECAKEEEKKKMKIKAQDILTSIQRSLTSSEAGGAPRETAPAPTLGGQHAIPQQNMYQNYQQSFYPSPPVPSVPVYYTQGPGYGTSYHHYQAPPNLPRSIVPPPKGDFSSPPNAVHVNYDYNAQYGTAGTIHHRKPNANASNQDQQGRSSYGEERNRYR